jgi:hypothetical protein
MSEELEDGFYNKYVELIINANNDTYYIKKILEDIHDECYQAGWDECKSGG